MSPVVEIVDRGSLVPLVDEERGRGRMRVASPIRIRVGDRLFEIEAGFESDGSSRPWWAAWFVDPWGRRGIPGIFHDWLLRERLFSKRETDWLYMGTLHAEGVADLQAVLMFLAVRTKPFGEAA